MDLSALLRCSLKPCAVMMNPGRIYFASYVPTTILPDAYFYDTSAKTVGNSRGLGKLDVVSASYNVHAGRTMDYRQLMNLEKT